MGSKENMSIGPVRETTGCENNRPAEVFGKQLIEQLSGRFSMAVVPVHIVPIGHGKGSPFADCFDSGPSMGGCG
jgi:hypothetical protein